MATIGVVCMTRGGAPSSVVRECMEQLPVTVIYYPWMEANLYETIESSPITHWFFTGNTPDYVTDPEAPTIDRRIYTLSEKSFFFVCYSHQLLCMQLGSPIRTCIERVEGIVHLDHACNTDPVWKNIPESEPFYCWYNQYVDTPPADWVVLARYGTHIAVMRCGRHYSAQVHPERCKDTHKMIENWLSQ